MNYLELGNEVLKRLREPQVDAATYVTNPYHAMIGAAVNDAMRSVSDAWQWTQLRNTENLSVGAGEDSLEIPATSDVPFVLKGLWNERQQGWMRQIPVHRMQSYRQASNTGTPYYFSPAAYDPTTRNKRLSVYPVPTEETPLVLDRWKAQQPLVNAEDVCFLPPVPVYTLAFALAASERGEIGGMSSSERYVLADKYLSDAIALDSAYWPDEMDWSAGTIQNETNVRRY